MAHDTGPPQHDCYAYAHGCCFFLEAPTVIICFDYFRMKNFFSHKKQPNPLSVLCVPEFIAAILLNQQETPCDPGTPA